MTAEGFLAGTVVVLTLPILVFFCAKLGRYGWLAAEHRFRQNNRKDGGRNERP